MRGPAARLAGLLLLLSPVLKAEPLSIDKVPEPLKPWISWVLDGHEDQRCPSLPGGAAVPVSQRPCFWPAKLSLNLDDRQGRFTQDWQTYKEGWAPLPGDSRHWPLAVLVDGKPAAVMLQNGVPSVRLAAGAHGVSGEFRWDSLPELLQIPRETGLVGLSVRGAPVAFPNRDEEGRLWLQRNTGSQKGEDRLEVVVHRRVMDEVPLILVSDIELKVSGKNREALLGRVLPPGFQPTSLSGPLPARLEKDSRLRVQVRPGDWRIELSARHEGPVAELAMPVRSEPNAPTWDKEVWVFDARPDLRLVTVEGVSSIDPQQTELPGGWRQLPAYLMRPGDTMKLIERRRGDSEPNPDQLSLQRTLWLDFDGRGYSIRDHIEGTLRQAWRMEMAEPEVLGRVAVDGTDQFITRLKTAADAPKTAGIEMRRGTVHLDGESRLEGSLRSVPAVGWDHDFHQVSAVLNLPPGWRLIHAFGVDDASPTWINDWTLLDLFILLMVAVGVSKLWDRRWGAVALAAFGLCYHEPGAPRWILVFLLITEALARALPEGRLSRVFKGGRLFFRTALVVVAIPFLISQVRVGVYPQLENLYAWSSSRSHRAMISGSAASLAETAPEEREEEEEGEENDKALQNAPAAGRMMSMKKGLFSAKASVQASYGRPGQDLNMYPPDLKAQVSTGPGMPSWSWDAVTLSWRGPVKRSQRMTLLLVGPFGNRVLSALRCALFVLLSLLLLGGTQNRWRQKFSILSRALGSLGLLALVAALLIRVRPAAAAEMPTPALLKDLQDRLLRPAECEPNCASISRLRLEASPWTLVARLDAAAGAATSVALPGTAQQWTPSSVLLDGVPAKGLWRSPNGLLFLPVLPGSHQVLLEGPLPDHESVQLALPLKPHRVEARATGWRVDGIREDGLADDSVQLTRLHASRGAGSDSMQPGVLPPFVRIERILRLGLSWQVETRVLRMSPPGSALALDVPLLPGESVTTAEVPVEKGKVKLSLGPQAVQAAWTSVLSQSDSIKLSAPDSVPWTEVWRVDASPIWHVASEGIPVIHAEDPGGERVREWRPWPGESVTLSITRPEGVPGQTVTVDRSALSLSPGLRATDARLELSLRASRGGQQTLTLPEGAEIQSLSMDGAPQPVRQEKRGITLAILPGSHEFELAWRQGDGVSLLTRGPEVDLGLASVNSNVSVSVPQDRWVLAVGGPRLGPAVLFWSALVVMLLVSVGLGKLGLAPLGIPQWFLLAVGLTQVPMPVAAVVAGWLLALGVRRKNVIESPFRFNLVQVCLTAWTVAALRCLYIAIQRGLLGQPEMQIAGNGSGPAVLNWYQDRTGQLLPRPWLFSLPRMAYRLAMLAWALWIASSLIGWLQWGWGSINEGGLWKAGPPRKK